MSNRPTADEAARALQDVDQRRDQALDSVGESRWVHVLFGVAIFLFLAAPDFFGEGVTTWTSLCFTALVLVYSILLRTRKGSTALGRSTRIRRDTVPPRFARYARLVILAVVLVSLFFSFQPHPQPHVPYLRTITGAILGIVLVVFGQRYQQGLLSLAKRSRTHGVADGPH